MLNLWVQYGLFFGMNKIIEISLLAFCLGAIVSIFLIIIRNIILKNKDEYMPFGPFLVVSGIVCMFLPDNSIFIAFMTICEAISNGILSIF